MERRILLPAARSAMVVSAKTKKIQEARVAMAIGIVEEVGVETVIGMHICLYCVVDLANDLYKDIAAAEMMMIIMEVHDMDETAKETTDTTEAATMAETGTGNGTGIEGGVIGLGRDRHAAYHLLARG
jgi:hypothetical protein